ncbi:MAG: DUF2244 domain-containing protein [Alphaproteobacteria bacterium]|nr:DUF2244 domain-containing protein [Alphaproteobacteria bacterium]
MVGAMTPHWERTETPPAHGGPFYMRATLTPHRSLSRRAFTIVLVGFAVIDAAVIGFFLSRGAWPVAIFLALDVAALWLAFHINYRDARAEERVEVATDRLLVSRFDRRGRNAHWMVSPLWVRVAADARAVRIASAGRTLRVGAFLTPEERGAFAAALNAALAKARAGAPA